MTRHPALTAWRRRGDLARRDDIWAAACWEAAAVGAPPARAAACLARAAELVEGYPLEGPPAVKPPPASAEKPRGWSKPKRGTW